jgi:uncharacterized damage-inducible protein DinB
MTIAEILLPEFDAEMANTRKLLACVPDGKDDWAPHAKSMALMRLASHVAEMPNWAIHTLQLDRLEFAGGEKPWRAANAGELVTHFDAGVTAVRPVLQAVTDEAMARPWSLVFSGHTVFTMPKSLVMRNMVLNHMVHHRAQLGVYLRILEIPIPGMYGPSADDK